MDEPTRNLIESATQKARSRLEQEFGRQLEGDYNILPDGRVLLEPGANLNARECLLREKLVAAIEHRRAQGMTAKEARDALLREAAFTTLNRFVALKMLEARKFIQPCISQGEQSSGFREFMLPAEGLIALADKGYRLYLESLFDEIGREVRVLFDRRDVAGQLWPNRQTLTDLLGILNDPELAGVWDTPETVGWVYQYFNRQDERSEMRRAPAPRNSYELAVRNQFFTPDYVVAFLADNTLGCIWYEMHAGNTRLADDCRYMVRRPNESISEREKKDPRDLRVLDPAVGSGHYLLYCFELFLMIYEEGWADLSAPTSELTGKTLREDYISLDELRRAAPSLILRHNLYGVDIDSRAAQIAELALWMRAQQAYEAIDVHGADRTPIRRTNIVVAEPMPGDKALLSEFLRGLDERLRPLVEAIWEQMRLADEAGTLLRIEKAIEQELRNARARRLIEPRPSQTDLFDGRSKAVQEVLIADEEEAAFWAQSEDELLAALEGYAHAASGMVGARRRLFADNAAQGFAFLDVCRTRYDVVLMNPPFGKASKKWKPTFDKAYPRTKNDLYAAFVERGLGLLHHKGMLGAITSRTGFLLPYFRKWRAMLLHEARPTVVADLGYGVLDKAAVETAAYCLMNTSGSRTTFFHLLFSEDKKKELSDSIQDVRMGRENPLVIDVDLLSFSSIPGNPFAYWIVQEIKDFYQNMPLFESKDKRDRIATVGMSTKMDFRYLRAWWEVEIESIAISRSETFSNGRWVLFAKGGRFSPFYYPWSLVVDWKNDGYTLKEDISEYRGSRGWGYQWSAAINGHSYYFNPGLTFGRRIRKFAPVILQTGMIFSDSSNSIFLRGENTGSIESYLGLLNSNLVRRLISAFVPIRKMEVGFLQRLPVPYTVGDHEDPLSKIAIACVDIKRGIDASNETSRIFYLPALLLMDGVGLAQRAEVWSERIVEHEQQLSSYQQQIDDIAFDLYSVASEMRETIENNLSRTTYDGRSSLNESDNGDNRDVEEPVDSDEDDAGDDEEHDPENVHEIQPLLETTDLIADLVSYAVGCAFGRWDVRCAIGKRERPKLYDPFAPLPVYSPGMLTAHSQGYPLDVRDILVDDEGHPDDIVARIRAVLQVIWGDREDDIYQEIGTGLIGGGHNLRPWLQKTFFESHKKRYTKSKRKAPIYWCLSTPSRSYSVWFYYHRCGKDTLYKLLEDYIDPKIDYEQRKLSKLTTDAPNPTASQRKAIQDQTMFVAELRTFREEIVRVAPLWNPDLNDGIIINYALLWRLTPWPRDWYDECRATWEKLRLGDYDWAHLAMRLWPERVVRKCREDRSLAIAHGLDDVFWELIDGERDRPRDVSESALQQLISERTSSAVVAALQSLNGAPIEPEKPKKRAAEPEVSSGKRRGRKPKSDVIQIGMDLDE